VCERKRRKRREAERGKERERERDECVKRKRRLMGRKWVVRRQMKST
jgi:hypothetical protein